MAIFTIVERSPLTNNVFRNISTITSAISSRIPKRIVEVKYICFILLCQAFIE